MLVPALATVWLVRELVRDEERGAPALVLRSEASPPSGSSELGSLAVSEPRRPDELQQVRRASDPDLDRAGAKELVQDPAGGPGSRYLGLRRLESLSGPDPTALAEAEAVVLAATDDPDGRFLAVNALAVLARAPGGHDALARCVERAPTDSLRKAARILLARRAR